MTTPCIACGLPTTLFVHTSGQPQDRLPVCDRCAPEALHCRVCGLRTIASQNARFRLVYETPFDAQPHVWAFCTPDCEAAELHGQWAPELCERCGREIPAYALGEGRLPAQFTQVDGHWVCLSCAKAAHDSREID